MLTDDHTKVILRKVENAKASEFGVTAAKVELEAELQRETTNEGMCQHCDEGQRDCRYCNGSTTQTCELCTGDGEIRNPDYRTGSDESLDITCPNCDGSGDETCSHCDGDGTYECNYCHGNWEGGEYDWSSTEVCHNWFMERLAGLGLAEHTDQGERMSHGSYSYWKPVAPLTYAEFYDDGSVDSELTFTILLDKAENILLLPKVIEIFKDFAKEVGTEFDLHKAGMHTAFLQDPEGKYPVNDKENDQERFDNFSKSMNLLLPALYFLGSPNENSRGLEYRQPRVCSPNSRIQSRGSYYDQQKYSAIFYRGRALEYRIFNTCYDNPDAILDNIVVMANTLRYWSLDYRPSGLARIAKEVRFGNDDGDTLHRFYRTTQHIDLLNAGLKKLKPSYYTIKQLKEQRHFDVDKKKLNEKFKDIRKAAELQYKQYVRSEERERRVYRARVQAEMAERFYYENDANLDMDEAQAMQVIGERADEYFNRHRGELMTAEQFVESQVERAQADPGRYTLREDEPEPEQSNEFIQFVFADGRVA